MQFDPLKRRDFITLLGGAAAWPLGARGQQLAMAFGKALSMSLIIRFALPNFWSTSTLIALLASTVLANAREFRAADIQEENHPTVQAIRHMG